MMKRRKGAGLIAALAGCWAPAHAAVITDWNTVTVTCVQGAPTPANRAGPPGLLDIALVQAAVHDAVQAIQGRFEAYEYENSALRGVGSPEAAAAAAAHGVLVGLYGADDPCLASVVDPAITYAGNMGLKAGAEAAAALLPLHRPTVVLPTDPFRGSTEIGQWRPTPPAMLPGANTFMALTAPFAMKRPSQFRPAPPPRLKSWRYVHDYYEVKALGSLTSSARTAEQTDMARFWTVNFFSQLNEALRGIADEHVSDIGDQARLFALVSFALADSQISIYEVKYLHNFWRPITAIQEGNNDGNPLTIGDPSWTPLVTTPAYPEYSSGASCLLGAFASVLQSYFATDKLDFVVHTTANVTTNPRSYTRFSQVAREVVEARILQGIHFRTADEVGLDQGTSIGKWTFKKYLRPIRGRK
jgi:PAP2 superfamily